MQVLQVLPELNVGGVERGTVEIAAALVAAGDRSTVISAGGALVREVEALGSTHIILPVGEKSLASLSTIPKLHALLRELAPDIVHVRSRLPAWLVWAARRRLPEQQRPAVVATVHGLYSVSPYSAIMVRADRVIVISEAARDYVIANYPNVPHDKIRLVYRGVDATYFAPDFQPTPKWLESWQKEFPRLCDKRILLLPGRLSRLKGAESFLRLIAELPPELNDVVGVTVGGDATGKFETELSRLSDSLGLGERIVFAGHRADMREWFRMATLVFSLSTRPEAFGRTVIEALSMGVPVVAFDSGGPAETVRDCFPAGLIPDGDLNALRERVVSLLQGPVPDVGPCAFTLAAMQRNTLDVYRELAGRGGRS